MIRTLSLLTAIIALIATMALAPVTRAFDHGSEATPQADEDTEQGHDEEMGMSGTGAAYMMIRNAGAEGDHLVGGETHVAKVVEIHEIVDTEGVMEMRPLADGLDIPAGGEATLEPGGYHVMLIGLTEDLTNGMTFDLTLHFEHAGDVTVPITVRPRAELAEGEAAAEPVVAGDITIEDAWSRPAPALGGGMDMGTPEATPAA
jgi:copper(I)-binding protein